ncbi:MAG: hypothetical protein JW932_18690 [Deltaproteobacteria bacterium]|nr:hypothetical protein [Deltaproteobacteria bacterium]
MPKNSNKPEKDFTHDERVRLGLLAVFPSLEDFRIFCDEDDGDPEPFIRLARETCLLENGEGKAAFETFIKKNALPPSLCSPPVGLRFGGLLEDKAKIKTSIRGLTDWINELIVRFQFDHLLPAGKVSNVTFSRLQREPANTIIKRNTLRLLSFWFGYKRPQLGQPWNYETLLKLCPREYALESDHGVRIVFDLSSRGDVIESKSVKWLTNEVRQCVKDLSFFRYSRIQSINTTSFFLDLPKEEHIQSGIDHPGSYGRCIKDAISIAHQISVRWTLSPHGSPRRMLTIGIAAGELSTLDLYLQSIIQAKLPMDSAIRMTDYAHLCVLVNDIRATFYDIPKEVEMLNGEVITVWWITGLWNTNFWDLVPPLLTDPMLQTGAQADLEFRGLLLTQGAKVDQTFTEKGTNAVPVFLRYPQNSLLGLEIARTLYFRRRLKAADDILSIILSADPSHLPARTLRMEISWLLGMEAPIYSVADFHFRQAEKEAALIDEICTTKIEDYFCEYALGKMGKALKILRLIRSSEGRFEEDGIILGKDDVIGLLEQTENLFEAGMALSSRGYRSYFFLLCARSLKKILFNDPDIFIDPEKPIRDKQGISRKTALDVFYALGWLSYDHPLDAQLPVFNKFLLNAIQSYDESIYLRTAIPNIKFHFSAILLDFTPVLTVGLVKTVLQWLEQARELAREYERDDLSLVSSLRCHKEVLSPDPFIHYIEKTIKAVEAKIGTLEDLERQDDHDSIAIEQLDGLVMFALNI